MAPQKGRAVHDATDDYRRKKRVQVHNVAGEVQELKDEIHLALGW